MTARAVHGRFTAETRGERRERRKVQRREHRGRTEDIEKAGEILRPARGKGAGLRVTAYRSAIGSERAREASLSRFVAGLLALTKAAASRRTPKNACRPAGAANGPGSLRGRLWRRVIPRRRLGLLVGARLRPCLPGLWCRQLLRLSWPIR